MKNFFDLDEFFVTDTNIPNTMPLSWQPVIMYNIEQLRGVLNVLRGLLGSPITINSAYRNEQINRIVGGDKHSKHLSGLAADITCRNLHLLLDHCKNLHDSGILTECIYYPDRNFIHVAI